MTASPFAGFAKALFTAALFGSLMASSPATFAQTPYVTSTEGTGPFESFLDINFTDGDDYLFGYFWNYSTPDDPSTAPDGYDLLEAFGPGLVVYAPYNTTFDEHEIDEISYKSDLNGNAEGYDPSTGSFWNYYTADTLADASTGGLTFSAVGADERELTPGSVDAWDWDQYEAVTPLVPTAPAPETDTLAGLIAGLLALVALTLHQSRARRRTSVDC